MKKFLILVVGLLVLGTSGILVYLNYFKKIPLASFKPSAEKKRTQTWRIEGVRIPGRYCDAEIVKLDDGSYRMYYSVEPEVPDNQLEMYSATSVDGLSWKQEEGIRMRWSTFPSVIRLPDGPWRMYYQKEGVIKSSISSDGLSWSEEEGVRIDRGRGGSYDDFNVASPTVILLKDGTYKMFYRGSVKGKYDPYSQQDEISRILSASSKDGFVWQKEDGIAVDSMNEELHGQVDGPELFYAGEKLNLYFNSFMGVYVAEVLEGGKVGSYKKVLNAEGPEFAPSDVTLMKMNGALRMYFGIHTKGIHSAVLK